MCKYKIDGVQPATELEVTPWEDGLVYFRLEGEDEAIYAKLDADSIDTLINDLKNAKLESLKRLKGRGNIGLN